MDAVPGLAKQEGNPCADCCHRGKAATSRTLALRWAADPASEVGGAAARPSFPPAPGVGICLRCLASEDSLCSLWPTVGQPRTRLRADSVGLGESLAGLLGPWSRMLTMLVADYH